MGLVRCECIWPLVRGHSEVECTIHTHKEHCANFAHASANAVLVPLQTLFAEAVQRRSRRDELQQQQEVCSHRPTLHCDGLHGYDPVSGRVMPSLSLSLSLSLALSRSLSLSLSLSCVCVCVCVCLPTPPNTQPHTPCTGAHTRMRVRAPRGTPLNTQSNIFVTKIAAHEGAHDWGRAGGRQRVHLLCRASRQARLPPYPRSALSP